MNKTHDLKRCLIYSKKAIFLHFPFTILHLELRGKFKQQIRLDFSSKLIKFKYKLHVILNFPEKNLFKSNFNG